MSKFVVVTLPEEKNAYEALHALQGLHAEGSLTMYGTSVVHRDASGKLSILKRDDLGPIGVGLGMLVGGLVGLFGGPAGAVLGATAGATAGGIRDLLQLDLSEEFLDAIERELAPGKFAVVAEISEDWAAPLDTRMAELRGKVVREEREAFRDDLIEKRVNTWKAELGRRRVEHAQHKAERAGTKAEAMMEKLFTEEIEDQRRRLESIADNAERRLDCARQELDAKIEALLAQASGATPAVRKRIEQRMADLRDEFAEREQKLTRAGELTRQALHA